MKDSDIVLGIDFGTTNSCISYYDGVKATVIPNYDGNYITPTCLFFGDEEILVGESAYQLLQSNNNGLYIGNIIYNIKRLVGIPYCEYIKDVDMCNFFNMRGINIVENKGDGSCSIEIENLKEKGLTKIITIYKIIDIYIKYLISIAVDFIGDRIVDVVITVPVYFNSKQRKILQDIFQNNDLNVLRVINEPTAAALAYRSNDIDFISEQTIDFIENEHVLVIDCGGGTTDFSLLEMDYNIDLYKVVNVIGDNYMGGEDITNNLVNYVLNKIKLESPNIKQITKIKRECESIKCQLSFNENAKLCLENIIEGKDIIINISRTLFNEINTCFYKKIKEYIKTITLGYDIDRVVLVGGSCRINYFKQIIKDILGDVKICDNLDNEQIISIGASIEGYMLKRQNTHNVNIQSNDTHDMDDMDDTDDRDDVLLMDITGFSLGVGTAGDIMTPIVSKNSTIPINKSKLFTNSEDYISELEIDIYQGNRIFTVDNIKIGTLLLTNLDNTLKAGEMKINVIFDIDANGIITVTARDYKTDNFSYTLLNKETVLNKDTDNSDELDNVVKDSYKSQQIIRKLELENSYKKMVNKYIENKEYIHKGKRHDSDSDREIWLKGLEDIMNKIRDTIYDYTKYTPQYLKDFRVKIEDEWHNYIIN